MAFQRKNRRYIVTKAHIIMLETVAKNPAILTIFLLLVWIAVMTIILAFIPSEKINTIGSFFARLLPKIPFAAIIKFFKGG